MSNAYFKLSSGALKQDWSDAGLITTDDSWANVPSIMGYRGDDITAATGVDPQTLTGDGTVVVDVTVNQANPNTFTTGGVAEFAIANPTVALQGSGTADAPNLVIYLDASGRQNLRVQFNARDIDGSADNAIQSLAVQYRIGGTGTWINIPAGFIADATSGPSLATLVTAADVTLPGAANNQAQVEVRIITANAVGSDEWVGIDDIVVTSDPAVVPTPGITVSPAALSLAEGGAAGSFTVVLNAAPTDTVTIAITDTADADADLASLTFTPGNWNVAQKVAVSAVDDLLAEGTEPTTIVLGAAVSNDAAYAGIDPTDVVVTIADNDAVAVIVTPIALAAMEGGVPQNFSVVLGSQPTADVKIDLTGNADVTLGVASVTFTTANWNTAQTVNVSAIEDGLAEGNEVVAVTGTASSADATYNGLAVASVQVTVSDATVAVPVVINEFVFDHTGTDTSEFIELRAGANADLSAYRLLVLEGDAASSARGVVTALLTPGAANAAGYWASAFLANQFQNGTQTLLLVKDPTAGLLSGADLDTNNDGVLDATPWGTLVDAVAVSEGAVGDLIYAGAPVLGVGFDGLAFEPGGASRLPDGVDTNTASDWVRNDFAGAGLPGFTGTLDAGEALNTAGAANQYAVAPVAGFRILPAAVSVTEGGAAAQFTVRLNTAPSADVTVAVSGNADATVSTGSLTFTTANWFVAQAVTVTAVDDLLAEGTESLTIALGTASSSDLVYNGLDPADVALTVIDNEPLALIEISAIQGAAHVSPLVGQAVRTSGIVTARDTTNNGSAQNIGFWIQDPTPDANAATSEAVFVFTGTIVGLPAIGDAVTVIATVVERPPANAASNLATTRLETASFTVDSSGNALPLVTVIGVGGRVAPTGAIYNDASGNLNTGIGDFDPASEGIDFFESLEGMLVQVNNGFVAGATNRFGETWVLADNGAGSPGRSVRGGVMLGQGDDNPERIQVQYDSGVAGGAAITANVAQRLSALTGVLSYDFGNYEVVLTSAPVVSATGVQQERTNLVGDATRLTIAEFNVENLDPGDTKFGELARLMADHLKRPDVLALQEMQDNNGATNDGTVAATLTAAKLIAAIYARTGIVYSYADVPPANGTSGGEPGGNIRPGFLYNSARVSLVAGSLRTVDDTAATAGDAFASSRKPLAGDFLFNNNIVTLINVHSSSKGGSGSLFGSSQPAVNGGEAARVAQATEIKAAVDTMLAANPTARIGIVGDFNEFSWNASQQVLTGGANPVLFDLGGLLPLADRYSYVFDGSTQQLDHTLGTKAFRNGAGHDVVHINAEFSDATRVSDHDPAVTRLALSQLALPETPSFVGGPADATNTYLMAAGGTVTGGSGADLMIARAGIGTLAGAAGADVFGFFKDAAGGQVTIADFAVNDRLTLQGYAAGEVVNALTTQMFSGGATQFTLSDGTQVALTGVGSITAGSFI